ncbi:MAG: hypothetical protein ACRDT4_16650 [Micromonosporaceae bacterium]
MARRTRGRAVAVTSVTLLVLAGVGGGTAIAATPTGGTVSPTAPEVTWQGATYAASAIVDPAACIGGVTCDEYALTVDVPASYWNDKVGGAEVSITWGDVSNDFDLYIYNAAGDTVASSAAGSTTSESAVIPSASGTYTVVVVPWLVTNSSYQGAAKFVSQAMPDPGGQVGGPAAYRGYQTNGTLPATMPQSTPAKARKSSLPMFRSTDIGHEAAEPTIGVDTTGNAFYAAGAFDGPAGLARTEIWRSTDSNASWSEVTPIAPVVGEVPPTTLDPYIWVHPGRDRVFSIDLYVGCSYLSYSDNKGQSWNTNPLACGDFVNDHQTLFSGPAPAGLPTLDPAFPEALYYCFNRVADSSCGRSLDGGKTFLKAGLPAYEGVDENGQLCGGLHGHGQVDPQGRVLLPKGHCGEATLAISSDGAMTWTRKVVSQIPIYGHEGSIAADKSGNLYYAFLDERDQLPYLTVSRDHGQTWSNAIMVAPPAVKEAQFAHVVAGDDGRIAISFVGNRSGDDSDPSRPWDHYVTITENALATSPLWLSNITNAQGDPVHRGECAGRCGNMFDFLDVVLSPVDGSVWATVVDTCTDAKNGCASNPSNGPEDARGIAISQIAGPMLYATMPCTNPRKC